MGLSRRPHSPAWERDRGPGKVADLMVSAPQHVRRRPTRTWTQRFALFVGVVLVVGCLGMASAIGYVYWKTGTFALRT